MGKDSEKPIWQRPEGRLNSGSSMLGEEEVEEVLAVIRSGCLSRDYGPDSQQAVLRFEQGIAESLGVEYALGVTSGTAALKVALAAAGVGPGHEVIMPCCTFISSASSAMSLGAVPVFAEIDTSLAIDPDDIEHRITERTRAILPVHLYGVPCQMDRITEIAKRHSLKVIENCALSCGTTYQGKCIGAWGDMGAISLQIVKVITAGEGGVVTSSDPVLYERAVRFHDLGGYRQQTRLQNIELTQEEFLGEVYRMPELVGAVAVQQLAKLGTITSTLRSIYRRYREGVAGIEGLTVQPVNDADGALATRWGLVFDDAETCTRFSDAIRTAGLSPGLMYGGTPIYLKPSVLNQTTWVPEANPLASPLYKGDVRYHEGLCPRSEDIMKRVLMVASPNPRWSERDVDMVLEILQEAASEAL